FSTESTQFRSFASALGMTARGGKRNRRFRAPIRHDWPFVQSEVQRQLRGIVHVKHIQTMLMDGEDLPYVPRTTPQPAGDAQL
ncbi:hypothetical protein, partial [Polymorphobacter multimanifer]